MLNSINTQTTKIYELTFRLPNHLAAPIIDLQAELLNAEEQALKDDDDTIAISAAIDSAVSSARKMSQFSDHALKYMEKIDGRAIRHETTHKIVTGPHGFVELNFTYKVQIHGEIL